VYSILIMCYYYYYCFILITGLQVSPTYKSQVRRFSLINRYRPCNMILIDLIFFLYNAETWPMWEIYSVPCDSTLNKFYCMCVCIYIYIYIYTHTHTHKHYFVILKIKNVSVANLIIGSPEP
jgi:hypothetical protein